MKIPQIFEFMGLEWNVVFATPETDGKGAYGCTIFADQTIYISPKLSKMLKEQTFLHELMHVIFWQMGVDKMPGFNAEMEEPIVNQLTNGLYAALKQGLLK